MQTFQLGSQVGRGWLLNLDTRLSCQILAFDQVSYEYDKAFEVESGRKENAPR